MVMDYLKKNEIKPFDLVFILHYEREVYRWKNCYNIRTVCKTKQPLGVCSWEWNWKRNHNRLACRVCSMYEHGTTVLLVKQLTADRAVPGHNVVEDMREGNGFSYFRVGVQWQDSGNLTTLWRIRGREVDLAVSEYGFFGRMVRM